MGKLLGLGQRAVGVDSEYSSPLHVVKVSDTLNIISEVGGEKKMKIGNFLFGEGSFW